jgi:hypothetical protein
MNPLPTVSNPKVHHILSSTTPRQGLYQQPAQLLLLRAADYSSASAPLLPGLQGEQASALVLLSSEPVPRACLSLPVPADVPLRAGKYTAKIC